MFPQSLIGLFVKFSITSRIVQWVAGGLMGLAVLGWVVEHSGPTGSEVVVHVVEPDVQVALGDQTFQIEGRRYDPIVCDLVAGWHHLIMRHGDRVLFEESFEVRPGKNIVLTAWDPERIGNQVSADASVSRVPRRGGKPR